MSNIDKNKIFFGLIHYILSEQQNVDWVLKTSLIHFTGVNSLVDNKKYQDNMLIDDIIEYIYDVKPYHVDFEQFIEKYSSQRDDVNISGNPENEKLNIEYNIRFDAVSPFVDEKPTGMTSLEYLDTHAANRLYEYKTKNLEEIADYLNCNFKGLTVEGGEFELDKSGYDAFLYDESLYDAPTITADYYFFDYTEKLNIPYTKEMVAVGVKTLKIIEGFFKETTTITSEYKGEITTIQDFSLENDLITLYYKIKDGEKITIIGSNGIEQAFIFIADSFTENTKDSNERRIIPVGTTTLPIPDGNLASKKVTVHKELSNGSRIPFLNYKIVGNNIEVSSTEFKHAEHLVMTVLDYQYIYDKIYTWEDPYGQSNNTVILDGDKFLRPHYEGNRPSELCASHTGHHLLIYKYTHDENIPISFQRTDFKNVQTEHMVSKSLSTTLTQDFNLGDDKMYIDDINSLLLPTIDETTKVITPGTILINSELIEFHEVNIEDKYITKLRRGTNGSYIKQEHLSGSIILAVNLKVSKEFKNSLKTISTFINKHTENSFTIPGEYYSKEAITVYKKPLIKLLTAININKKTTKTEPVIKISSDNVQKPLSIIKDGKEEVLRKGLLYINDDIITFDSIIENAAEKCFEIRGYDINKSYTTDSTIYSTIPEVVDSSNYHIDLETFSIVFQTPPSVGECVIVTNR